MTKLQSWRASSAVKSFECYCRGIRLRVPVPTQQDTILTPVSRDLMPSKLLTLTPVGIQT